MSDKQKPNDDERDDESLMTDEELESVAGGCQIGPNTSGPKFPDTLLPPTTPPSPF